MDLVPNNIPGYFNKYWMPAFHYNLLSRFAELFRKYKIIFFKNYQHEKITDFKTLATIYYGICSTCGLTNNFDVYFFSRKRYDEIIYLPAFCVGNFNGNTFLLVLFFINKFE